MTKFPTTLEEARACRYWRWAGNPRGTPYQEGRCAHEIYISGRGGHPAQCSNKPGKGPGELYCAKHAVEAGEKTGNGAAAVSWYRALGYEIHREAVIRSTDKMVWLKDRPQTPLKIKGGSMSGDFYKTREEAVEALRFSLTRRIALLQNDITRAEQTISTLTAKLRNLK